MRDLQFVREEQWEVLERLPPAKEIRHDGKMCAFHFLPLASINQGHEPRPNLTNNPLVFNLERVYPEGQAENTPAGNKRRRRGSVSERSSSFTSADMEEPERRVPRGSKYARRSLAWLCLWTMSQHCLFGLDSIPWMNFASFQKLLDPITRYTVTTGAASRQQQSLA